MLGKCGLNRTHGCLDDVNIDHENDDDQEQKFLLNLL